jgi:hypothetical protein
VRSFKVCAFCPILLGLLYQEDMIDRACSMYGDKMKHKILVRKVCGRDCVGDLGVAGRIMLFFIVEVL